MLSDTQSRQPFVGIAAMLQSKRHEMPAAKEIVKTIYYDYVKTEVSYV